MLSMHTCFEFYYIIVAALHLLTDERQSRTMEYRIYCSFRLLPKSNPRYKIRLIIEFHRSVINSKRFEPSLGSFHLLVLFHRTSYPQASAIPTDVPRFQPQHRIVLCKTWLPCSFHSSFHPHTPLHHRWNPRMVTTLLFHHWNLAPPSVSLLFSSWMCRLECVCVYPSLARISFPSGVNLRKVCHPNGIGRCFRSHPAGRCTGILRERGWSFRTWYPRRNLPCKFHNRAVPVWRGGRAFHRCSPLTWKCWNRVGTPRDISEELENV